MNNMKSIVIIIFLVVILFYLVGCSHTDPEAKTINEHYSLVTKDGKVALIKHIAPTSDEIILCKNFVAYSIIGEGLVLCEENDTANQLFYFYNLNNDSFICYESYSKLTNSLDIDEFTWVSLWVKDFRIKTEQEHRGRFYVLAQNSKETTNREKGR